MFNKAKPGGCPQHDDGYERPCKFVVSMDERFVLFAKKVKQLKSRGSNEKLVAQQEIEKHLHRQTLLQ